MTAKSNMSLDADPQLQKADSPRVLPSGQLQRCPASIRSAGMRTEMA